MKGEEKLSYQAPILKRFHRLKDITLEDGFTFSVISSAAPAPPSPPPIPFITPPAPPPIMPPRPPRMP